MIDWINVALNALWVVGLSVILAAFSYHHWLAAESSRPLRDVLSRPSWTVPFSAGMALTCLGFGYGLGSRWWERAIWTALAIVFTYELLTNLRQRQRKTG